MMAQDSTSAKGKEKAPAESSSGPEKDQTPNIIPKLSALARVVTTNYAFQCLTDNWDVFQLDSYQDCPIVRECFESSGYEALIGTLRERESGDRYWKQPDLQSAGPALGVTMVAPMVDGRKGSNLIQALRPYLLLDRWITVMRRSPLEETRRPRVQLSLLPGFQNVSNKSRKSKSKSDDAHMRDRMTFYSSGIIGMNTIVPASQKKLVGATPTKALPLTDECVWSRLITYGVNSRKHKKMGNAQYRLATMAVVVNFFIQGAFSDISVHEKANELLSKQSSDETLASDMEEWKDMLHDGLLWLNMALTTTLKDALVFSHQTVPSPPFLFEVGIRQRQEHEDPRFVKLEKGLWELLFDLALLRTEKTLVEHLGSLGEIAGFAYTSERNLSVVQLQLPLPVLASSKRRHTSIPPDEQPRPAKKARRSDHRKDDTGAGNSGEGQTIAMQSPMDNRDEHMAVDEPERGRSSTTPGPATQNPVPGSADKESPNLSATTVSEGEQTTGKDTAPAAGPSGQESRPLDHRSPQTHTRSLSPGSSQTLVPPQDQDRNVDSRPEPSTAHSSLPFLTNVGLPSGRPATPSTPDRAPSTGSPLAPENDLPSAIPAPTLSQTSPSTHAPATPAVSPQLSGIDAASLIPPPAVTQRANSPQSRFSPPPNVNDEDENAPYARRSASPNRNDVDFPSTGGLSPANRPSQDGFSSQLTPADEDDGPFFGRDVAPSMGELHDRSLSQDAEVEQSSSDALARLVDNRSSHSADESTKKDSRYPRRDRHLSKKALLAENSGQASNADAPSRPRPKNARKRNQQRSAQVEIKVEEDCFTRLTKHLGYQYVNTVREVIDVDAWDESFTKRRRRGESKVPVVEDPKKMPVDEEEEKEEKEEEYPPLESVPPPPGMKTVEMVIEGETFTICTWFKDDLKQLKAFKAIFQKQVSKRKEMVEELTMDEFKDLRRNALKKVLSDRHLLVTGCGRVTTAKNMERRLLMNRVVDIQDLYFRKSDNVASHCRGTLQKMKEIMKSKDKDERRRPLNALDLPCGHIPIEIPRLADISFRDVVWSFLKHVSRPKYQETLPMDDFRWALYSSRNAYSTPHVDSNGLCTAIAPVNCRKLWILGRPRKECLQDSRALAKFRMYDVNLNDYDWAPLLIKPGDILYMKPGTVHAVVTVDPGFTIGEHFYTMATLEDSLASLFHLCAANAILTNASHNIAVAKTLARLLHCWRHRLSNKVEQANVPRLDFENVSFVRCLVMIGTYLHVFPYVEDIERGLSPSDVSQLETAHTDYLYLTNILVQHFDVRRTVYGEFNFPDSKIDEDEETDVAMEEKTDEEDVYDMIFRNGEMWIIAHLFEFFTNARKLVYDDDKIKVDEHVGRLKKLLPTLLEKANLSQAWFNATHQHVKKNFATSRLDGWLAWDVLSVIRKGCTEEEQDDDDQDEEGDEEDYDDDEEEETEEEEGDYQDKGLEPEEEEGDNQDEGMEPAELDGEEEAEGEGEQDKVQSEADRDGSVEVPQ